MPRRQNHEGTEWRDKTNGRWRWRIRWEGETHFVSDAHRARAREKRDALIAQLRKNVRVTDARQTLTEYLSYWLEAAIRRNVSESTYFDYRKRCELYIVPSIGHYALTDLSAALLLRWTNATRDNYALSSARQALALVRRALNYAVGERIIEYNPAASVQLPQAPRKADTDDDEEGQRALTPDQERAILEDVRRHDAHQTAYRDRRFNQSAGMYVLYSLAFALGLRRGELLGLRRKDIDVRGRILKVRQQVIRLDGEHKVSSRLKTKSARRDLPLTDALLALLIPHLLRLGGGDNALLFPATGGGPLNPSVVTKHFTRTCKRCGLAGFTFHDTRHTAITRWRAAKVDAETAAALAGHGKPDITVEVYSTVDMARKRAALGE